MIIYFDQNHLIDLSKNVSKLNKLKKLFQEKDYHLGISFSHIIETINIDEKKREPIIQLVDQLSYFEMNHIGNIINDEVLNEFYRYLNLKEKVINILAIAPIFKLSQLNGFVEMVRFFSLNPKHSKRILEQKMGYEEGVRKLANEKIKETAMESFKSEKKALLDYHISNFLSRNNTNIRIVIPLRSLDVQDFEKFFSWERCPYLNFYTLFQTLRYRDINRNTRGDLSDIEHATIGAMSCDVLCIEKNAYEIINQAQKYQGQKIKAKVFKNLDETIDFLN
jgi:hypothetical protein